MSYAVPRAHYTPHDDVTKAYYERLLLDIRRALPPGVIDDIEDIAEDVLAIVCSGGSPSISSSSNNKDSNTTANTEYKSTSTSDVKTQQHALEQLLGTRLTHETRDHLLRYRTLLTDYVSGGAVQPVEQVDALGTLTTMRSDSAGVGHTLRDGIDRTMRATDDASLSSTSSDEDDENDEALLTGMPRRRKHSHKADQRTRNDRELVPFAFTAEDADGEAADMLRDDDENANAKQSWRSTTRTGVEGATNDAIYPSPTRDNNKKNNDNEEDEKDSNDANSIAPEPTISFNTVACNVHYVKDSLRRLFPAQDVDSCAVQEERVLDFLAARAADAFILETQLTAFLGGYDDEAVTDWICELCASRWNVVYGVRYARCQTQKERYAVMETMREHAAESAEVERLYQSLTGKEVVRRHHASSEDSEDAEEDDCDDDDDSKDYNTDTNDHSKNRRNASVKQKKRRKALHIVDLEVTSFHDERSPHQHRRAAVPAGTQRGVYETHDEIVLPPTATVKHTAAEDRASVHGSFPAWARPALDGLTHLNAMQSRVYSSAFLSDENLLVSAPTGAGKTNVAVMTMLRCIGHALRSMPHYQQHDEYKNKHTNNNNNNNNNNSDVEGYSGGSVATDLQLSHAAFRQLKMVYVAPMKALVQEVVRTFTQRLAPLGLTVVELSGDASTTQRQLLQAQLIVTTPEKWDIVTRKSIELGVAASLRLLIIDEVHLLHNTRGAVLEAIVARTRLQQQMRANMPRSTTGLLSLSPTSSTAAAGCGVVLTETKTTHSDSINQMNNNNPTSTNNTSNNFNSNKSSTNCTSYDADDEQGGIRIVGLSATLPNVDDVAAFLRVNRQRGLHVFDSRYRPVPLEQSYCAVKRIPGINIATVMNRIVYDKALAALLANEQMMIFVHSRRETEYTAAYLYQRAHEEHRERNLVRPGSESELVLEQTCNESRQSGDSLRRGLVQLLPHGCAFHHAGLSRFERQTVEMLFAQRHIRLLVCTSTLAWGVNLPAQHVIIKGTRVYTGQSEEPALLSALDVLQMFGRAGRLGFAASGHSNNTTNNSSSSNANGNCINDNHGSTATAIGHATILTTPDDLHYYVSLLNQQLPIESHLMSRLVDMLNAEVVLGHVSCVNDGVRWLERCYLSIRMRQAPHVYGISVRENDSALHVVRQHMANMIHTACLALRAARMIDYDVRQARVAPTAFGRIASYCYLTYASMSVYLSQLRAAMHEVDVFGVFAQSSEFAAMAVRASEQTQLKELLSHAPIAVVSTGSSATRSFHASSAATLPNSLARNDGRGVVRAASAAVIDAAVKANLLLQCYISGKGLEGLPLMSELVYIKDSALRVWRAMYEICLVREYGSTARLILRCYTMTLRRQWTVQTPVRQISRECANLLVAPKLYSAVIAGLERLRMPWPQVRQLDAEDWVERLGEERRGLAAHVLVRHVPHYRLDAAVRPLSRQMLYIDVDITPMFTFDPVRVHREPHAVRELHLFVELPTGRLIHHECVRVPISVLVHNSDSDASSEERYSCAPIVIPVTDPAPTHILVHAVSPYWLGVEAVAAVCLLNTQLPAPAPALREVTHSSTDQIDSHHRGRSDSNRNEEEGRMHDGVDGGSEEEAKDVARCMRQYGLAEVSARVFPFAEFNAMQRALVEPIMERGNESIFVGVPPAGGKTAMAEMFVLQFVLAQTAAAQERLSSPVCPPSSTPSSNSRININSEHNYTHDLTCMSHRGMLLYVTSHEPIALRRYLDWSYKFGEHLHQRVAHLDPSHPDYFWDINTNTNPECANDNADRSGNSNGSSNNDEDDVVPLWQADIVITTGAHLIRLLRRNCPALGRVTHVIADHVDILRTRDGRALEECLARLHSIDVVRHKRGTPYAQSDSASAHTVDNPPPLHARHRPRLLVLSYPLISSAEIGRWLRIPVARQYNFGATYRTLHVRIASIAEGAAGDAMSAPGRAVAALTAAMRLLRQRIYRRVPCVLFVAASSSQAVARVAMQVLLRCRSSLCNLIYHDDDSSYHSTDDSKGGNLVHDESAGNLGVDEVEDRRLALLLRAGVGYLHRTTSLLDVYAMLGQLDHPLRHPRTQRDIPLLLVCTFDAAWRLPAGLFHLSLVCGAEHLPTRRGVSSLSFTVLDDGQECAADDNDDTDELQDEASDDPTHRGNSGNHGVIGHANDDHDGEDGAAVDCSAAALMQMVSRGRVESVVYARAARRWVWSRWLNDPLPLESHMRYPVDFAEEVNAAVSEGRVRSHADVLRVLQKHYFLYHVRTHVHFYGVPALEDMPLYASDFAARVVSNLRRLGCVHPRQRCTHHPDSSSRSRTHANSNEPSDSLNEEKSHAEEEEDEEDEEEMVRGTWRGAALARYGVSIHSMQNIHTALRTLDDRSRGDHIASTDDGTHSSGAVNHVDHEMKEKTAVRLAARMARVLSESCVEWSSSTGAEERLFALPAMADAEERRRLHHLARILPTEYHVRYTDLDFSQHSTKLHLLILAWCAGMLPTEESVLSGNTETGAATDAESGEQKPDVDVISLHSVVPHITSEGQTSSPVAGRSMHEPTWTLLASQLQMCLPALRAIVMACVELIDGARWPQWVRATMRLTQALLSWPLSVRAGRQAPQEQQQQQFMGDSDNVSKVSVRLARGSMVTQDGALELAVQVRAEGRWTDSASTASATRSMPRFWWVLCYTRPLITSSLSDAAGAASVTDTTKTRSNLARKDQHERRDDTSSSNVSVASSATSWEEEEMVVTQVWAVRRCAEEEEQTHTQGDRDRNGGYMIATELRIPLAVLEGTDLDVVEVMVAVVSTSHRVSTVHSVEFANA